MPQERKRDLSTLLILSEGLRGLPLPGAKEREGAGYGADLVLMLLFLFVKNISEGLRGVSLLGAKENAGARRKVLIKVSAVSS